MSKRGLEETNTHNFDQLIRTLIPLSECDEDISLKLFVKEVLPVQWIIIESEYGPKTVCPCGHDPIYERCYIQNILTDRQLYVGNVCITRFSDNHDDVCKVITKLRKDGFEGSFKGECPEFYRFRVTNTRNHMMVKFNDAMVAHFDSSPLDTDTMMIKIAKNPAFNYNFVINAQYSITVKIQRTVELMYVITGVNSDPLQDDFDAYKSDNTKYGVRMVCASAASREVELHGSDTFPIRNQIRAHWKNRAKYEKNPSRWVITRNPTETLASIRHQIEVFLKNL
jgi:hypothetical protein